MPQFRDRLCHGAMVLLLGAGAMLSGCSTTKPSTAYLKNLQQGAMRGEFAQATKVDVATDCPTCDYQETIFAQHIVGAEQEFAAGCKGMPRAEASYRKLTSMIDAGNSTPEYGTFVTARKCQMAKQYQICTAPAHRLLPAGDRAAPAGALTAAIDQCREASPAEADEILNRAIAQESESINRAVLAGDFASAKPELRVYAALPRSSKQRTEQWRTLIADQEAAAKTASARTSARIKNMVCDENYFVQNAETGYGTMVAGMNMSHGGRIAPDNPFMAVSKTDTKESRMAVLSWELSNVEELPMNDAQQMLQTAYARASKDHSYCSSPN